MERLQVSGLHVARCLCEAWAGSSSLSSSSSAAAFALAFALAFAFGAFKVVKPGLATDPSPVWGQCRLIIVAVIIVVRGGLCFSFALALAFGAWREKSENRSDPKAVSSAVCPRYAPARHRRYRRHHLPRPLPWPSPSLWARLWPWPSVPGSARRVVAGRGDIAAGCQTGSSLSSSSSGTGFFLPAFALAFGALSVLSRSPPRGSRRRTWCPHRLLVAGFVLRAAAAAAALAACKRKRRKRRRSRWAALSPSGLALLLQQRQLALRQLHGLRQLGWGALEHSVSHTPLALAALA